MHRALAHVAQRAEADAAAAREKVARLLPRHGSEAVSMRGAPVTLNFHPDRLRPDGVSVAEGLLVDGHYRSQFDTGVTSGSPDRADRTRWEDALFGDAYVGNHERPKYGAFNVMAHPDGGSPRFGSCFLELAPATLTRCTFTWGDSHMEPEHVGTIDHFDSILAAWLDAIETTGTALGGARGAGRALDDYIEAQVHGPIDLARDVTALVADPSFDGTPTGAHLRALATRYGLSFRRHSGFVLHPSDVPLDFRGPRMRPLAERIAGDAMLDAVGLGNAARSLVLEPELWAEWGTSAETWQHIKQLWHVLVRFGHARRHDAGKST